MPTTLDELCGRIRAQRAAMSPEERASECIRQGDPRLLAKYGPHAVGATCSSG